MEEPQPPGVQCLPLQEHRGIGRIATDVAARDPAPPTVLTIAQDGTADVVQVDADLMRAASFRQQLHRRKTLEPLQNLVKGLCRPAFAIVAANGHHLADVRMEPDRAIDDVAIPLRTARDQGEILLLDRTHGELFGQLGMGLIVAGDENHAAGVAVEAVDNARPARPAAGAEGGAKMELQAPASVPDQCPRAGCTTMPGGLLTTATNSSS